MVVILLKPNGLNPVELAPEGMACQLPINESMVQNI